MINFFNFFNTNLHYIEIGILFLCIIFGVSLIKEKTRDFTYFLNRLSFFYLIFIFLILPVDVIQNLNEINQNLIMNNIFSKLSEIETLFSQKSNQFILLLIAIFFYGISDRFFIQNNTEIEYPILVYFIHFGIILSLTTSNIIEFVLGLEIITLTSYVLVAFERQNHYSTEGGVQYFILGSIPSAMLVLGCGLLYYVSGTLNFNFLKEWIFQKNLLENSNLLINNEDYNLFLKWNNFANFDTNAAVITTLDFIPYNENSHSFYNLDKSFLKTENRFFFALILIFLNFLFKLTMAPFHFWAPQIYGKAPIASSAFLSIASKVVILLISIKFYFLLPTEFKIFIEAFISFCAVLTLIFALIGAFIEFSIKKFYVYSSMGHVAFMMIAIFLPTLIGPLSALQYLFVYVISSYIMWFTLLHLGRKNVFLSDFKYLKQSNPLLGLIFAMLVFSMSGIPPLGGFFVKLDVLSALLENSRFYLNYIYFFFTVASFFYYLRLIKIIYFDKVNDLIKQEFVSEERLTIISIFFLFLIFYILLIQKPFIILQIEFLSSLL